MAGQIFIHESADVSPQAKIGKGTKIWQQCQIREFAEIGENCILSKGVYIDAGVIIGNNVKIQNGISVYNGVVLEDGVFCGPHCVFTNDKFPRAINPDGSLKTGEDWKVYKTLVKKGASIGAHATIVCGITIGKWAMIGAGAVVTKSVPDYGLVLGNPVRLVGFVCPCGEKLPTLELTIDQILEKKAKSAVIQCPKCSLEISIPYAELFKLIQ